MTAIDYIVGSIIILFSLIIIVMILLQEGGKGNLGVISGGGSDSFMDKGKSRTLSGMLSRWTKVVAIVFFVLVLAGMLITRYL